jgi:hypothetical protein
MDTIETAMPPLNLPPILLRSEMIEPGDVFLTRGGGFESFAIATLSGGG